LPNFQFLDGEQKAVALSAFRGEVVLLNVWATWCPPCREEMPALDRLQARLGDRGFQVLPLSIHFDGIAAVKAFYDEIDIKSLGIYVDASHSATGLFDIVGVPTTVLIGRAGREVGRVTGPAEWDSEEVIEVITGILTPVGA
jgi:thiol-disulfide isomerase/thioredoxin